jgi:hypothetical protein
MASTLIHKRPAAKLLSLFFRTARDVPARVPFGSEHTFAHETLLNCSLDVGFKDFGLYW